MTPEEINKKAKEAFPDCVDNERDIAMLRLGYETAYKEISALPTIKGWVARDKDEEAFAYLIGHITEMFYDAYAEYKEKKGKK